MGWGISGTLGAILILVAACLGACENQDPVPKPQVSSATIAAPPPIIVDGSSTVHLLSEAVLDLYASNLTTDVELSFSGTGGGFKKFCLGQTHINGASRPITPLEEKLCAEHKIQFIELAVAYDGIAVVVPRSNTWLESLTTKELARMWSASSQNEVVRFNQVRPDLPRERMQLFGPGLESGTFDFFNEAILGASDSSRADYKSSENDNEIAELVGQNPFGIGYFGLAYYRKYQRQLRLVAIDDENDENGQGPMLPTPETVGHGKYAPLSRPLFLYVQKRQLDRPEVQSFVQFYLKSARLVAPDVGYIGLGRDVLRLSAARLEHRKVGSVFSGVHSVMGLTMLDLLQAEEEPIQTAERH